MNEWSLRRKRIIFSFSLFCLVLLIGVPLFFFLHKAPTCSDGSQNGDESGVDCGGSCKLLCKAESLPLITKGDARVLRVATSTYEVVASVENPNVGANVLRASFTFKVFAASSTVPIKVIEGETYIPKSSTFVLFEGPFDLGDKTPARATLDWDRDTLVWQRDMSKAPNLNIDRSIISNLGSSPRLEARLHNDSLEDVRNIELVALIYDERGNIIGSSKTFVDTLYPGGDSPLVFTWPNPFAATSTRVEILPRILPDKSYLK